MASSNPPPEPVVDPAGLPPDPRSPIGRRPSPDEPDENYWFQRHVATYRHVAARVSGTVLDAGCGDGYGLPLLLAAGARGVIGADADARTADHARRRYADDTISEIDVIEADLGELPLVDDTLDAALCLQVVQALADPGPALAELVRVVHPGGRVAVSTPNRRTSAPEDGPVAPPSHGHEHTADELVALLEGAGLEVTEVSGVHHGDDLVARLRPHLDGEVDGDPVATLARPESWDDGLRAVVHAVSDDDFVVAADGATHPVASSLDLLAWGRVPTAR